MSATANHVDWAASVEAIVRRAPKSAAAPDSLGVQIRLLALLGSAAPLNVLLDGLAKYVETWGDGLLCSVLLVDTTGRMLQPGAGPSLPAAYVQAIGTVPIAEGHGSCGTAAARREMVVVEDVEHSELWTAHAAAAIAHGLRACWSMPVFDDAGALLATLGIYYRAPRQPAPQDIELIQFAALLAAFVIQRHRDAARLRASEARLGAAVWGTEIGLWESYADGTYHWFDTWPRRFGIKPQLGQYNYQQWLERVHPDDCVRYASAEAACVGAGVDHYSVDYRIRSELDRWYWIHERGKVTARTGDGTPTGFVGVCIDIEEQRATAAALRKAENLHALTIEAAQLPMWEYDVASDTMRGNVHWQQLAGYDLSGEQARARVETWLSDVHPDDVSTVRQALACLTADQTRFYESECRMRRTNGDYRWILDRARVVECSAGGVPLKVVGVSIDIDARKRTEESLRQSEARLEAAVGGSDIGLWDWHAGSDSLAWLSDWPQRKGIDGTDDHTTMADLMAAIHPADQQRLADDVKVVVSTRKDSIETEYRFRSVHGAYRWLQVRARVIERDARGRARRVVGSCIDVDTRRRAEEQLRTQAKILDTMNEGVVLIDSAGHIELTNPAFDRSVGWAPGQLAGESILSLLARTGLERAEPLAAESLLTRFTQCSRRFDVMFRRADGGEFTGEVITEPISLASGQKWLLVVCDVSERKQMEGEILDISNRERLRLGNDLHDGLGQELTGVALMLRSVATQLRHDSPAVAPQIDTIVALVNHAIESTRSMARGLAPVTIDHGGLGSALEELTSRSRATYGIDVQFRRSAASKLQIDEHTANHLYRITQEAINNAVKHGGAGSVRIALRVRSGLLELSVGDDGVGFLESATRSTGMGLKIMKYRARMIGGRIEIGPRRAGGTLVKCVRPFTQQVSAVPPRVPSAVLRGEPVRLGSPA